VFVVVNSLRLREPLPDAVLASARDEVLPRMREAGCRSLVLVRVDDLHRILLIAFDDSETLDEAAGAIGGPWMTTSCRCSPRRPSAASARSSSRSDRRATAPQKSPTRHTPVTRARRFRR